MLNSYAAWCVNDSLDLTDEFTTFFSKVKCKNISKYLTHVLHVLQ